MITYNKGLNVQNIEYINAKNVNQEKFVSVLVNNFFI